MTEAVRDGPLVHLPPRVEAAAIGLAVAGAFALRAYPFVRPGGAWGHPVDFDEGVYFSAASLLWRGVLPYRDFVFVHPPGILWALAPAAALCGLLGTDTAFVVARWLAALLGAVNVYLVARIARTWAGPVAGLGAAAVYASYFEVVVAERGPFIEPVLNAACLGLALCVQRAVRNEHSRWLDGAGVTAGIALSVKILAAPWLLFAALALGPRRRARFAVVAAATATVLIVPLALCAPDHFLTDVLWFHAWRPPDGTLSRLARVREILALRHLASSVPAATAVVLMLAGAPRAREPEAILLVGVYGVLWAWFLTSVTFWKQYNAHLAAPEAALAGFAVASVVAGLARRSARSARVGALVCCALIAVPVRASVLGSRARSPEVLAFAEDVRARVPARECLFAFDPVWALAAGRLPEAPAEAPLLVDTYAAQLLPALTAGGRFETAGAAFESEATQRDVRAVLDRCRFVALGWRGHWQLSRASAAWLGAHFEKRTPVAEPGGIDVWERAR